MIYNTCDTCSATDGRAGNLFSIPPGPRECLNCHKTRESGEISIHTWLDRTDDEIQRTFKILEEVES
tara:strand:+ start:287 stop:487 length:201 start_codon:yes stop_codon:yes gene_type:complete